MIGIIGAMPVEVDILKAHMESRKTTCLSGIGFTQGTLNGTECVIACCSPGKVNAAACAQVMIYAFHPEAVINSGVAGGLGPEVHRGDLVIADKVVQHDLDTTLLGDKKGQVPGLNLVYLPAAAGLVEKIRRAAEKIYSGRVHVGVIATGDQFIGDNAKCAEIHREFGALACEMEGAAVGHVCRLNGVDFAVIRTISDNGNDDAAQDFTQFAKEAAEKSEELLYRLLPTIL